MKPESQPDNYQKYTFLIPLGVSIAIITYFYALPGLTADGHIYLQIARNIRYGIGLGWQALWCPPMHSILIALASWLPGVPDILTAAGIVTPLMGVLLPVAVYFLAAGIFSRSVAVAAAIITAAFPQLLFLTFSTDADITYTVFLITALALLHATAKRRSYLLALLAGVFFSLAYQTRSEGFLVMLFTLFVLCASEGLRFYKSFLLKCCAVTVLAFLLTSSPYLLFLKKHYNAFVISPKSTYVLIWMKSRIYHDNDKGETSNEELWGLAPDGKYAWQHPSGLRDVVAYLMTHPEKSLRVYLTNLSREIPGRIPNNSGCLHYPQVYPVYLVALAIFMAFRRWDKKSDYGKVILFSPFLLLLILPVFTDGWWKYLVPYSPLIFIAGSAGLFQVANLISQRFKKTEGTHIAVMASLIITTLLAGYYLSLRIVRQAPVATGSSPARMIFAEETRKAAEMARQRFGPGRNYMVSWNKMIYYLDGLWTAEPIANFPDMMRFAISNNVEYIVRESATSEMSGADLEMVPPGLKLAAVYRSPRIDYTVAFYRVER
jgi:4-amino-4-deoxy-L-arabinose transferase-like glycosyltransferase